MDKIYSIRNSGCGIRFKRIYESMDARIAAFKSKDYSHRNTEMRTQYLSGVDYKEIIDSFVVNVNIEDVEGEPRLKKVSYDEYGLFVFPKEIKPIFKPYRKHWYSKIQYEETGYSTVTEWLKGTICTHEEYFSTDVSYEDCVFNKTVIEN